MGWACLATPASYHAVGTMRIAKLGATAKPMLQSTISKQRFVLCCNVLLQLLKSE